jgi:hypothetical protein
MNNHGSTAKFIIFIPIAQSSDPLKRQTQHRYMYSHNFIFGHHQTYLPPPALGPDTPAPITLGNSWPPISYNIPKPKERIPISPTVVPANSQNGKTISFL